VTELSKSQQAAIASAVERLASADTLAQKESALRRVFSREQLEGIAKWCKRHDTDRDVVIAEVVRTGIAAMGITASEPYSVLMKIGVAGLRSCAKNRDGF
jgi:hypothetical protein